MQLIKLSHELHSKEKRNRIKRDGGMWIGNTFWMFLFAGETDYDILAYLADESTHHEETGAQLRVRMLEELLVLIRATRATLIDPSADRMEMVRAIDTKFPPPPQGVGFCNDCHRVRPVREIYGTNAPPGCEYYICWECYEQTPEPDTGRPDWTDLNSTKPYR